MSVHNPETLRRYLHYRKKNDFVVIKYGAEWCGPCKRLAPALEKLAKEHPHVYFVDADIDKNEISEHDDFKDVSKIPHIKFFIDGELKREIVGSDEEKLHRYVKRYSEIKLSENVGNFESIKPERKTSERKTSVRKTSVRGADKSERKRSVRSDKAEKPDKSERKRSVRSDKSGKPERIRSDKSEKPERIRSVRSDKSEKPERKRSVRSGRKRSDKSEKLEDNEEKIFEVPIKYDGENYEEYLKNYEAYLKALEDQEDGLVEEYKIEIVEDEEEIINKEVEEEIINKEDEFNDEVINGIINEVINEVINEERETLATQ